MNNGKTIYATVGTGGSFGSSSLQQEIGVGAATAIEQITIHWQNSPKQMLSTIAVNQKIKVIEGQENYKKIDYRYVAFAKDLGSHHHH